MTLLLAHHFDYYGDTTKWRAASKAVSPVCTYNPTGGRWGGGCLKAEAIQPGDEVPLWASPGSNMIRCAGHFRTTHTTHSTSGVYRPLIGFRNAAGDRYWAIWLVSALGTTTMYASYFDDAEPTSAIGGSSGEDASGLADGLWHAFEFALSAHPSTGSFKMWLDGEEMTDITIASGDTSNAASGDVTGFTRVNMCGASSNVIASGGGGNTWLDDFIVWDDTGSDFTGEIGEEIRLRGVVPTANGAVSGWTPLSGSNFQNVDETTQDDDTTYNSANTPGLADTYKNTSYAVTPDYIKGVVVESILRTSTGQAYWRNRIKSNLTTLAGSSALATSAYVSQMDGWGKDPNGNIAWTKSAIEAAEWGVERD